MVEIRELIRQIHHHIFQRVGGVRGLGLRFVAHAFALAMNRHIPHHLQEEMRAIARGSGTSFSAILMINTLDDVLNVLRRLAPHNPHLGCSSFALFGSRSRDGLLIHGRNLDYHFRGTLLDDRGEVSRLLHRHAVIFVCRPEGRAAFLSVGWPGQAGTTTAMNRHGISLGNLTSYVRGTSPDGLPTSLLYRIVMEESSNLAEVASLLNSSRRTIGNNLVVGSGQENRAALFEITRDRVEQVPPMDGLLVATNHFVSLALALRQRPFLLPHSVARWKRLKQLCDRRGISTEEALAFLGDVGRDGDVSGDNPFARVANEGTAVSVLFRPASMEMWVGTSEGPPASRGEFRLVQAAEMLGSHGRGL